MSLNIINDKKKFTMAQMLREPFTKQIVELKEKDTTMKW